MQIAVGKTYRATNGACVPIVGKHGDLFFSDNDVNYTADGRAATRTLASLDLVADVPDLTFVSKFVGANGTAIEFFFVFNTPGFTHRVAINGVACDWLGHGKPSAKAARFFLDKHAQPHAAKA